MLIGRRSPVNSFELLEGLAAGKKPRAIAAEVGCDYETFRRRLSRHVRSSGFRSVEQAVAHHVADRIRANLPTALHPMVDRVLKR